MESHSPKKSKARKIGRAWKSQSQKDPHGIPTYNNVWSWIHGYWPVDATKSYEEPFCSLLIPFYPFIPSCSYHIPMMWEKMEKWEKTGLDHAPSCPCFSAGPGWAVGGTASVSCQAKGSTSYRILWRERQGWKHMKTNRNPKESKRYLFNSLQSCLCLPLQTDFY